MVQESPSLQVSGVWAQAPVVGSQLSTVHLSSSLQSLGVENLHLRADERESG